MECSITGRTFVLHTKGMGSSPIISTSLVSIGVVQRSFNPLTRVRFPHQARYSLNGKTLVSKISIIGSSPITSV